MLNTCYVSGQARATIDYLARAERDFARLFKPTGLAEFCQQTIKATLVSFGDLSLSEGFDPTKAVAAFSDNIDAVTASPYLQGKPLFRDSGGYQIQTRKVAKDEIPALLNANLYLLRKYHGGVHRSFSLDIVPPSGDSPFQSYAEVLDLNRRSLDAMAMLPSRIRQSIYAVHQFKTPRLHKLFHQLFFSEGLASAFSNWSVGGMASQREAFATAYVPWVLPLIEITHHMKKLGRCEFGFHVLGNAAFPDDITKILFAKLIQDVHGIRVTMTWDTNSFFVGFTQDSELWYADEEERAIKHMKIDTNGLFDSDIVTRTPVEMKMYELCKEVLVPAGAAPEDIEKTLLHHDHRPNPFFYAASMLIYFKAHTRATEWCLEEADDLYARWKSGGAQRAECAERLAALMTRMAGAQVAARVAQVARSLELLEALDPADAARLINIDMRGHEFPALLR